MKKQTLSPNYLLILVFLAGFSFLVYEVSWFRMLSLVLGATIKASTVVLAAFMAGFGAGAWYWGKLSGVRFKPLQLLKGLLIASAVIGFIIYFLINNVIPGLYSILWKAGIPLTLAEIFVFLLTLVLLFIPAFFMGGILPVVSGILVTTNTGLSGMLGRIYAWETLGSTLGGMATGFILIRFLGQQNTVFLAVFINIISVLPLLLFQYQSLKESALPLVKDNQNQIKSRDVKEKENEETRQKNRFAAILATTIFGFTVIGLQVA